jgi:hypothetical protein
VQSLYSVDDPGTDLIEPTRRGENNQKFSVTGFGRKREEKRGKLAHIMRIRNLSLSLSLSRHDSGV